MANMKTLTVNGVTYTVDDPDAVSYGAQQALTEAQKQLARENIGAVGRTEVDDAVSGLTRKDLDMKHHSIKNVVRIDIGNAAAPDGFSIGYENTEVFGRAYFSAQGSNRAVTLCNIAPGNDRGDAATKGQLDDAVKEVIDKTCPAFTESGAIVTCEPVGGYPLTVVTAAGATRVTRCGKNLLDTAIDNVKQVSWINASGNVISNYYGVELILPPGTYAMKGKPKGAVTEGYIYGQITDLEGHWKQTASPIYGGIYQEFRLTFDDWSKVIIYAAGTKISDGASLSWAYNQPHSFVNFDIQIEVGSTATAFEPYVAESFSPGDTVPALPGVNTIFADAGEVTVTGRANPATMIEKLTNAILSTGGNV